MTDALILLKETSDEELEDMISAQLHFRYCRNNATREEMVITYALALAKRIIDA